MIDTPQTSEQTTTDPMVDQAAVTAAAEAAKAKAAAEQAARDAIEPSGIETAADFGSVIRDIAEQKANAKKVVDAVFDRLVSKCLSTTSNGSIQSRPLSDADAKACVAATIKAVGELVEAAALNSAAISRIGHGNNANVNLTTLNGVQLNRVTALIGLHGFKSASKRFKEQVKEYLDFLKSQSK